MSVHFAAIDCIFLLCIIHLIDNFLIMLWHKFFPGRFNSRNSVEDVESVACQLSIHVLWYSNLEGNHIVCIQDIRQEFMANLCSLGLRVFEYAI